MPKKTNVSFWDVAKTDQRLREEGKSAGVQAIRRETGGASKTVLEHCRVLQEQKVLASKVVGPISKAFLDVLLAEIGDHVTKATEMKDTLLDDITDRADETLRLFIEEQEKNEDLTHQLETMKREAELTTTQFRQKEAVFDEKIRTLKDRIREVESDKSLLLQQLEFSKIEVGRLQNQAEIAEKVAEKAALRVECLEEKLDELREARELAEQRALVAETRIQGFFEQQSV